VYYVFVLQMNVFRKHVFFKHKTLFCLRFWNSYVGVIDISFLNGIFFTECFSNIGLNFCVCEAFLSVYVANIRECVFRNGCMCVFRVIEDMFITL
jgi:hypothetical protein